MPLETGLWKRASLTTLFHMAPGGLYQRQGGAPENPYAYELLPSIVQKDQPKHFRAAYAGIQVYQGGRYPKDTDGHLFFGNIHDNAIHEEAVEPVGATFKAKPVRDFLRANDGWFRPVSIQTGPDGFLWVMDWCDKYPCYQNAQANPEGVDREKGRIWRVVYNPRRGGVSPPNHETKENDSAKEAEAPPPGSRMNKDMDFKKMSLGSLITLAGSANSWLSRQALQALRESDEAPTDDAATSALLVNEAAPHIERKLALTDLVGRRQIRVQEVEKYGDASDSRLRRAMAAALGDVWFWAQKILNEEPRQTLIAEHALHELEPGLALLAADPDPTVRAEAMIAMRRADCGYLTVKKPSSVPSCGLSGQSVLANAIKAPNTANDKTMGFHIWMALEPRVAREPHRWLPWLAEVTLNNRLPC